MRLTGLADAVLADPTLLEAMADARAGLMPALDLTGPAALRPFVVAGAGRRRPHRAGGHRDRPRGRGPGRGAGRPGRPGAGRPTTRAGRRCRTSGSARAATPSAAGWPCCAGCATPAPTAATGRCGSSSRRSARCCSRRSRGSATSSRSSSCRGRRPPLDDVVRRLADAAYSRVDLVEKRGEFAVRGGIVDVFPPTEEHPLRVEFWGDDVEEIRSLRGRRPAHPRDGRAALGAAVPRAAAHRRGTPPGRRAGRGAPAAARAHRQDRRRHRRRGHGVARAGRWSTRWSCWST